MFALLASVTVPSIAQRQGYTPPGPDAVTEESVEKEVELVKERVQAQIAAAFDEIFAIHKREPKLLSHSAAHLHCADLAIDEIMGAALRAKGTVSEERLKAAPRYVERATAEAMVEPHPVLKEYLRKMMMAHDVTRFGFEVVDLVSFPRADDSRDDTASEMLTRLERVYEIVDAPSLNRADNRIFALRDLEAAAPFAEVLCKQPSEEEGWAGPSERDELLARLAKLTVMHMGRFALEQPPAGSELTVEMVLDTLRRWRSEEPGKWKAVNRLMRGLGLGGLKDKSLKDSWTNRRRTSDDDRNRGLLDEFDALAHEEKLAWARAFSQSMGDDEEDGAAGGEPTA